MNLKVRLLELSRKFSSQGVRGRLLYGFIRVILSVLSPRKSVALSNIRLAFPDKSPEWRRMILKKMYDHFSLMAVEYLALVDDPPKALRWVSKVQGKGHLDSLLNEKKGCILLTVHGGNWELLSAWICQSGYPLQAVVRDPDDLSVAQVAESYRKKIGLVTVRKDGASLRKTVNFTKKGGFLGLVADQDGGPLGIPVKFFRRPCTMPRGPAAISILAHVPVVPVSIQRLSPFRHKVKIDPPIYPPEDGNRAEKIKVFSEKLNKVMENMVRDRPEEWLWMHRRWKTFHLGAML